MLTYQLQPRRLSSVDQNTTLSFPNDVEVLIELEPQEPFGTRHGPSRTGIRAQPATVDYNANTGAATITPTESLQKVQAGIRWTNLSVSFDGNLLKLKAHFTDATALHKLLIGLQGVLPAILCIYFVDAPTIRHVSGSVGNTKFRWQFMRSQFSFDVTTNEQQEKRLLTAIELYSELANKQHARFMGGIVYFQRACRLISSGTGPWEFMGEAILNFAKCLQALFGESRDQVRCGLKKCGIETDTEDVFIPMMLMRNEFDVGHAWLSVHQTDDLKLIYGLLATAEQKFRDLLERIAGKIIAGESPLDSYSFEEKASPIQSILDRLRSKAAAAAT